MIYVPGTDPAGPPKIVAALVPADDAIMRFMRQDDPGYIEVRYAAPMLLSFVAETRRLVCVSVEDTTVREVDLSGPRFDMREWGQSLDSFQWAWGPARWVCPD